MRKNSFLWLFPLAAALFLIVPSDLSALTDKEERQRVELQSELQAKGKLSNSKQKKLAALNARADPVPQIAAPAPSLGTIPESQNLDAPITPPTAIDPQKDNTTLGLDGKPVDGKGWSDGISDLHKEQSDPEKKNKQDSEDKIVQPKDYPDWVTNPYSLEKLIRDAIKDNTEGDEDAKKVAANEFNLKDVYVGIGSATNASDSQAIQMAEARARQDLAFQQKALVKAEITDYSKNVTTNKASSNAAEDYIVAQQSIDLELTPVKVQVRDKKNGAWWVVVTALKEPEFQVPVEVGPYIPGAMDAVRLMDERLEKNKLKSAGVGSAATGMLDK